MGCLKGCLDGFERNAHAMKNRPFLAQSLAKPIGVLPKADGFDGILMPGEPENLTLAQRAVDGIPIPKGTAEKLREAARRSGLALPEGL